MRKRCTRMTQSRWTPQGLFDSTPPPDYNKFEDERKTQEMNLHQKKKNHEYKELCNLRTRRSRQKSRVPWKSRRAGEGGKKCCFIHPAG